MMKTRLFFGPALFIICLFFGVSAAQARAIIPTPQKIFYEGSPVEVNPAAVVVSSKILGHDPRILAALKDVFPKLTVSESEFAPKAGQLFIYADDTMEGPAAKNCALMFCSSLAIDSFGPQEYYIGIRRMKEYTLVLILFNKKSYENSAGDSYGEFYAVKTLKKLFDGVSVPEIAIHDWPEFPVRGVLEGFYGKPWPEANRKSFIPWMADQKYNIYLYTPKDDHKLRLGWRLKLDEKELNKIKDLNDLAENNYIRYCWSLSPGMNINFSSNKDLVAAYQKYKSVIDIGVKCFTLAFDDVGLTLSPTGNDQKTYKTYWEGQIDFSNKLFAKLLGDHPDVMFAIVPNDYWGDLAMESEYLRYLGANLDPRVSIGWTGNKIAPTTIVSEDAVYYSYFIRRKPFLGDNFPVLDNITTSGGRLAIGPLRGRDPRLFRYIKGFAANAMPLPESSKPAFLTIADFTWNPFNYDADRSWETAMKDIAGEEHYESLLFFAKQSESSLVWKYDAMNLNEDARAVINACRNQPGYDLKTTSDALRKMFERFEGIDRELLFLRNEKNSAMLDEMNPWIEKLKGYGVIGAKTLDMLERKKAGEKVSKEDIDGLDKDWQELEKNKAVITKMVMYNFMLQSIAYLRDEPQPAKKLLNTLVGGED